MRVACLAFLLMAACSRSDGGGDVLVGDYRGPDRDALCVAGDGEGLRAGLITYGPSATNCSLAGTAEVRGDVLVVTPRGDSECKVEISLANGVATVGVRSRSCAYYCGPAADYTGRVLRKAPDAAPKVADLGGDSLC